MLVKILVGALLVSMFYNLYCAMMVMLKNDPSTPPMSKYLGRRVLASVVIIIMLLLAVGFGYITPNPRPY